MFFSFNVFRCIVFRQAAHGTVLNARCPQQKPLFLLRFPFYLFLSHLAAGGLGTVFHPAGPAHRADARCLLEVREVFVRDCPNQEVCHVSAADGAGLRREQSGGGKETQVGRKGGGGGRKGCVIIGIDSLSDHRPLNLYDGGTAHVGFHRPGRHCLHQQRRGGGRGCSRLLLALAIRFTIGYASTRFETEHRSTPNRGPSNTWMLNRFFHILHKNKIGYLIAFLFRIFVATIHPLGEQTFCWGGG